MSFSEVMQKATRLLRDYWWVSIPVVVAAVLILGFLLDSSAIWSAALPSRLSGWDKTLLSNVLGVLAQILAVTVTILLTGVFVLWQYLGDKLPEDVIRPSVLGPEIVLALILLVVVFGVDLAGFFFNREGYSPVTATALIVLSVLVCVPASFILVARKVGSLSVNGIIKKLGETSTFQPNRKVNLHRMAAAVKNLRTTMRFLLTHGHTEATAYAFGRFLEAAKAWSPKVSGHLELTAGADHKAIVARIDKLFREVPDTLLDYAVQQQNAVVFGILARRLAQSLPDLDPSLRKEYEETLRRLVSADIGVWTTDLTSGLVIAGDWLAHSSVHKQHTELFNFGLDILMRIWNGSCHEHSSLRFSILDSVVEMGRCVETLLTANDTEEKARTSLREFRTRLRSTYQDMGLFLVTNEMTSLYSSWLTGFNRLLATTLRVADSDAAADWILGVLRVYEVSFHRGCDQVLRSFPLGVATALSNAEDKQKLYRVAAKIAPALGKFVYIAVNSGNDIAALSLLDLHRDIYGLAINEQDHKLASLAIERIAMFRLRPSISANNMGAFFDGAVTSLQTNALVPPLMTGLIRVLSSNGHTPPPPFSFLVSVLGRLAQSDVTTDEQRRRLVTSIVETLPKYDSDARKLIISMINNFLASSQDEAVLVAACRALRGVGLDAVESGNDSLVTSISSAVGWLGYNVIRANMAVDSKRRVFNDALDSAVALYKFSVIFGLSQGTLSFLSTLYAVLGAVCEERPDTEREILTKKMFEAVSLLENPNAIRHGIYARVENPIDLEEFKADPHKPYEKFLAHLESKQPNASEAAPALQGTPPTD